MPRAKRTRAHPSPGPITPHPPQQDILDQYLAEVNKYPLLSADDELALAHRIRQGDARALDELVQRNLRVVISVAKKYRNRGLSLLDLIEEGNMGLMTAARRFDPDRGVKFISYAVWWIRQAILAALARHSRTVRLPLNRTGDLSRVVKSSAALRQELDREPTEEELSRVTGLSRHVVRSLVGVNRNEIRLDAPLSRDGDRALLEQFVQAEAPDIEEEAARRLMRADLEAALRALSPRHQRVLRLYFGFDDGRERTLEEIGEIFGVTRERIRQLRDRALKHLHDGRAGKALATYVG
ncbi:MAG TPA: RNA polymerase sigma factor RpoD/SigA [Gemmatimonadaceae bacterium]|nr:RNA polymerase sigma factor RpoD/SigA [Gemmatimonadaceae bacterium]